MNADQKFICAMALGFIAVAAIYELVEAIYSVRINLNVTDMKPAKVIEG